MGAQEAGGGLRNRTTVLLHIKINLPNSVKAKYKIKSDTLYESDR